MKREWSWHCDVWLAILAILILLGFCSLARAHDWYESACCSGKDCKPVPDGTVVEMHDGVLVKGFGTLSESDNRLRWSQDDRDHICAQPPTMFNGAPIGGPGKLMCVYRKRKFM